MSTLMGLPHRPPLGDLPAEDQIVLFGHDRLVDAVAAAVWRLHALRGFTANLYGKRRQDRSVVVVPLGHDAFGYWHCGSSSQQDWARCAPSTPGDSDALRGALLHRAIVRVEPASNTITHTLRTLSPRPPLNQAVLTALCEAWWAVRLSEGQTDESARMLLSLTVPSTTLPWLRFGDEGPPEVLRWDQMVMAI